VESPKSYIPKNKNRRCKRNSKMKKIKKMGVKELLKRAVLEDFF